MFFIACLVWKTNSDWSECFCGHALRSLCYSFVSRQLLWHVERIFYSRLAGISVLCVMLSYHCSVSILCIFGYCYHRICSILYARDLLLRCLIQKHTLSWTTCCLRVILRLSNSDYFCKRKTCSKIFSKGFFCCTFVTTSLKHLQKSFGCSYMKGQAILAIGGRWNVCSKLHIHYLSLSLCNRAKMYRKQDKQKYSRNRRATYTYQLNQITSSNSYTNNNVFITVVR